MSAQLKDDWSVYEPDEIDKAIERVRQLRLQRAKDRLERAEREHEQAQTYYNELLAKLS